MYPKVRVLSSHRQSLPSHQCRGRNSADSANNPYQNFIPSLGQYSSRAMLLLVTSCCFLLALRVALVVFLVPQQGQWALSSFPKWMFSAFPSKRDKEKHPSLRSQSAPSMSTTVLFPAAPLPLKSHSWTIHTILTRDYFRPDFSIVVPHQSNQTVWPIYSLTYIDSQAPRVWSFIKPQHSTAQSRAEQSRGVTGRCPVLVCCSFEIATHSIF
jgi:hypothetical protein